MSVKTIHLCSQWNHNTKTKASLKNKVRTVRVDTAHGARSLCGTRPGRPHVGCVSVSPACAGRRGGRWLLAPLQGAWQQRASRGFPGQLRLGSKGFSSAVGAVCPITAAWSRWEGWAACSRRFRGHRRRVWTVRPSVSAEGPRGELLIHSHRRRDHGSRLGTLPQHVFIRTVT